MFTSFIPMKWDIYESKSTSCQLRVWVYLEQMNVMNVLALLSTPVWCSFRLKTLLLINNLFMKKKIWTVTSEYVIKSAQKDENKNKEQTLFDWLTARAGQQITKTAQSSTSLTTINHSIVYQSTSIFLSVILCLEARALRCALLSVRSLAQSLRNKPAAVSEWNSTQWSIGCQLYGIHGVDSPIMWEHGHQFEWKSVAVHQFQYHRQHRHHQPFHRHIHHKMIAINTLVVVLKWVFALDFHWNCKRNEMKRISFKLKSIVSWETTPIRYTSMFWKLVIPFTIHNPLHLRTFQVAI